MSQNAMSLVPDSVRLEIAQQKAAKAAPVSVDQMLQKARVGAAPENARQSPAAAGKADGEPSAEINAPDAAPLPGSDVPKPQSPQKTAVKTTANEQRGESPPERRNAVELFEEARALQRRAPPEDLDFADDGPTAAGYGQKSTGGADAWRKMLAQMQESPEDPVRPDALKDNGAAQKDVSITTSSLPDKQVFEGESILVKFNDGLTGLARDDDLKIRLLRHGKRLPETIAIGRIDGVKGYQAMQKALVLGKIIAGASGGNPGISYDPALSPRAAELVYAKPGVANEHR